MAEKDNPGPRSADASVPEPAPRSSLPSDIAPVLERIEATTMLARTEGWASINSGTTNLAGLATMAELLAAAFPILPGALALRDPAPAESIAADGARVP